jgi:hypothetical protein
VKIDHYWSGARGPSSRAADAVLLWSETAFYVRFTAFQREPLVVSGSPELRKKSIGLWDRDVFEVFIAPFEDEPNKYFEFEIAPNGEWLDVAIEILSDRRISDWAYNSGMKSATRLEKDKVILAIKVEWKALGRAPSAGNRWKGNLFRCVGKDAGRGYLAWQPTMTSSPNFHVPEKFGEFLFTKPIVP